MTNANKEANLECVPCIWYPVQFKKNQDNSKALIDSGSKVNAMNSAYAKKLDLRIRQTDVGAQKIDGSYLEIFGMVITSFSL